jgi:hypothetical protein
MKILKGMSFWMSRMTGKLALMRMTVSRMRYFNWGTSWMLFRLTRHVFNMIDVSTVTSCAGKRMEGKG